MLKISIPQDFGMIQEYWLSPCSGDVMEVCKQKKENQN